MKCKYYLFIFIIFSFVFSQEAIAQEKASGSSAVMDDDKKKEELDKRAIILRKFLEKNNSPLASSSAVFVKEADKYKLDWKFVAAISGIESSFGQFLPYNSYNAWGWGIYGDKVTYFTSYDEGIKIISKSLKEDYMGKWGAKDVYQIGKIYAASPTWAQRVIGFMNDIEKFAEKEENKNLPIYL